MKAERDLFEDRNGEYPAHVHVRDFRFEGTELAAVLWLGNENSGTEVNVLLTDADVVWMITSLQQALDESRRVIS